MADEKTKPEGAEEPKAASEGGVDLESVRVKEMELTEQQLRMVSGGKGYGRGGIVAEESLVSRNPDLAQVNPAIAGQ